MGFFDKKSESNVACVEKIKKFLKETGTGMGFMSNGSVKAVAQMIQPEEKILYAVCANVSMGEPKGKLDLNTFKFKNKINGVVVLTNERVVFGASSGYSASKVFYLTDITAVDDGYNGLGAVLRVQTNSSAIAIDGTKKILSPLRDAINNAIHQSRKENIQTNNKIQVQSDADEILKFKKLMDEGIISTEEFEAKKKQLLGL